MRGTRNVWLVLFAALALIIGACSDDETKTDTGTDTGGDTGGDMAPDVVDDTTPDMEPDVEEDVEADVLADADVAEPVYTTVHFAIDDSANQVYDTAAGLAWKGDFSYDSDTGIMEVGTGWAGPFVILFDDGPEGGEPEGETAGDGIWTIEVLVEVTDSEQSVEYGAIRGSVDGSDGNWIWGLANAANGSFTIGAGDDSAVTAAPLTLPAFGWTDLLLTIDLDSVPDSFIDQDATPITSVEVKGNTWAWDLITLAETDDATDGATYEFVLGDETGEGNAQPYDGLLNPEQVAEFVFVLNSIEYKLEGVPPGSGDTSADDGIVAYTDANVDGDWVEVDIALAANNNTSIEVPFWPAPDTVAINFAIDDSANASYDADDGLAWKGDFAYDAQTRVFTPNVGWTGPFANVWDDGPWADGGHEAADQTSGDNIWSIAVFMPESDSNVTVEYGAIRGSVDGSDGGWIWTGSNGMVTVTTGDSEVTADGLTIAEWGETDFQLTIDLETVPSEFADWTAITTVEVKGSAWSWTEIAMVEDETSANLYSLVLGDLIGTDCDEDVLAFCDNTGLLNSCDQPEFVFVLDDIEYKIGGVPPGSGDTSADQGIIAYTDTGVDAAWEAQDVVLAANNNTSIVVPTCE